MFKPLGCDFSSSEWFADHTWKDQAGVASALGISTSPGSDFFFPATLVFLLKMKGMRLEFCFLHVTTMWHLCSCVWNGACWGGILPLAPARSLVPLFLLGNLSAFLGFPPRLLRGWQCNSDDIKPTFPGEVWAEQGQCKIYCKKELAKRELINFYFI